MKLLQRTLAAITLTLSATTVLAKPEYLITHNNTNEESNAFIAGSIPSPHPTAAHSTRKVYWNLVRLACYGHTTDGKCSALIRMATNTPNPIDIGYVHMDLVSGDITPKQFSAQGYTFTVNGLGEATIDKD
jgi:hypothetical protein